MVLSVNEVDTVLHPSLVVGVEKEGVAGQLMVAGPPTLIVGGVISLTVIVCDAVAVLPQTSVAVHFLVTE